MRRQAAGVRLGFVASALVALASPCLGAPAQRPAPGPGAQAASYLRSLTPEASGVVRPPPIDPAAQPVAQALAKRFGVEVLRARPGEIGGKPVYRIVVMRPGGDYDDAYAVDTLTVDAATGQLLPQFRNEVSGYRLSSPPDRTPRDNAVATTIRRESFQSRNPGR